MTPDLRILCHPNIPKPLHGINPRTVYGTAWWDRERKKAYEKAHFMCEACLTHKTEAEYHQWLEAHEFYTFDYKRGRVTFDHLVALCHACHQYIHDGRMNMLVVQGEMDWSKRDAIIARGDRLLAEAGLTHLREERHGAVTTVPWMEWRMVIDGKEYGPSSGGLYGWTQGQWRGWTPDRPSPAADTVAGFGRYEVALPEESAWGMEF
jgi:hypothetical protein